VLKLTSPTTVAVLAALTALGPLATDMYLPAMPTMTESLNTGPDQVQLTLSLYMAGFAMAQLLCGPLSDRFGRKPIMVGGTTLFLLASLLCAFAPSIEVLLIGRFLQAFGGAGPLGRCRASRVLRMGVGIRGAGAVCRRPWLARFHPIPNVPGRLLHYSASCR
jgi:DHA1 family bicyclomycin/chloramphenicol resistance-like MFS transporter